MEILKKRYESLVQALASLQDSIELLATVSCITNIRMHAAFRDSCIQRFEYSFDAFWKFIKLYLEEHEGKAVENNAPRFIFKVAENADLLLTNENLDILLEALSDRNLTSHSYNIETAERIVSHIPLYYRTMHAIVTQLKI